MTNLFSLPTFGPGGSVQVVIEASRGSSAKCKFDPQLEAFLYSRPLPRGLTYPFDWGFIPSTCAEDGDPLDAMVVHSAVCPVGAVVRCRPLAMLKVSQRQESEVMRNDRILLTPIEAATGDDKLLGRGLKDELEQFFCSSVLGRGKKLTYEGWSSAAMARDAIKRANREFLAKD
ncbi:MAG: inorganic diphosphatase [Rhodospirillaceae bacterium]